MTYYANRNPARPLVPPGEMLTDTRGVEHTSALFIDLALLPSGWAQCGDCGRSWNDTKSTSVTPTPSARCPFEAMHDDDYDDTQDDDHFDEGGEA